MTKSISAPSSYRASLRRLFICALLFPLAAMAQYKFQGSEYIETRNLAMQILRQCPPETCIPIGLGRSPTPVMTFIKEMMGENSAWQLPLSKFNYGFDDAYPAITKGSDKDKILKKHFANHFPTKDQIGSKKIMLIDYTASGKGLAASQKYLKQYLGDMDMGETPVEHVALCNDKVSCNTIRRNKVLGLSNTINLEKFPVLSKYIPKEAFDHYSQYGSYDIAKIESEREVVKLEEQTDYAVLKAGMRQAIAGDKKINKYRKNIEKELYQKKLEDLAASAEGEGEREATVCAAPTVTTGEVTTHLRNNVDVLAKYFANHPGEYTDEDDVLGIDPDIVFTYNASGNAEGEEADVREVTESSYIFNNDVFTLKEGDELDASPKVRKYLRVSAETPLIFKEIVKDSYHKRQ